MKRKSSRPRGADLCGQLGPDDGVDPKKYFQPQRSHRPHRKDLQLCRQIRDTLSYLLSGETGDELLQNCWVDDVQPFPDATRVLVRLANLPHANGTDPMPALERLQQRVGWLRAEIGRSISRRKVPELVFQFVVDTQSEGGTP